MSYIKKEDLKSPKTFLNSLTADEAALASHRNNNSSSNTTTYSLKNAFERKSELTIPHQQDRKESLSSIQDSFSNFNIDPATQLLSLANSIPINIAQSAPNRLMTSSSASLLGSSFGKRRVSPYPIPKSANNSKSPTIDFCLSPPSGLLSPTNGTKSANISSSGSHKGKWVCDSCGKTYKHPNCLGKHRWEHTEAWKETNKLSISKHQQVKLLEAASVLVGLHSPASLGLDSTAAVPSVLLSSFKYPTVSQNGYESPSLSTAQSPIEMDENSEQSQVDVFGVDWSKIQ
jgi:hypothetical protein